MNIVRKLTRYGKEDCAERISAEKAREIQMDMLNTLADYCDSHGLRYYLSGGTLLGAIRHKGFIPWDDDIDTNMPRPDLMKLKEMTGGKLGKYTLVLGSEDSFSPSCQWCRLYDEDHLIENFAAGRSKTAYYHPLFIDIFPIEGFPSDDDEAMRYSRRLKFLRKIVGVAWHDHIMARSKRGYVLHAIANIPVKLVGHRRWRAMFQKLATKYDFDTCDHVGVTTTIQYLPRERVVKKDYLPIVKVPFEGKEYNAPANYDTYLSQLYGDYMKMPPVEKRRSDHVFVVYARKK